MKYKPGDIVLIKNDLINGRMYGEFMLNQEGYMSKLNGKLVKIIDIQNFGNEGLGYLLRETYNLFVWTDEMIQRKASKREKDQYLLTCIAEAL